MAVRVCSVSFTDARGIRHSADVQATSLFEAAALALGIFGKAIWLEDKPGPGTRLEVDVKEPAVRHTVTVQQLTKWAESTAVTPADRLQREAVKRLLESKI